MEIKETLIPVHNFDTLSCASDAQVLGQFDYYCRHSKKQVLPKPPSSYSRKLTRKEDRLTIHVREEAKVIGRFSFIPADS